MSENSIEAVFKALSAVGDALNKLPSMPTIQMKTMGGKVFWRNLANVNGWRLQKNIIVGTCRILDPDDVRRAWGGESALLKMLQDLSRS